MIAEFIESLEQAGLAQTGSTLTTDQSCQSGLTGREIAEALYLALYVSAPGTTPVAAEEPETAQPAEPPHSKLDSTFMPARHEPDRDPGSLAKSQKGELFTPQAGKSAEGGVSALPFRVAAAIALPGAAEISRAIRPLSRRVPSRTRREIDFERTVQQIADGGPYAAVERPAPERWLDLALVVDEGASMRVWRPTISELQRLLERQGAFRDVRVWGISADDSRIRFYRETGMAAVPTQLANPCELFDPYGRRLIVLVSDCIGQGWHTGAAFRLLAEWGERNPVVLAQILPQRLWSGTALPPLDVELRASAAGIANKRLQPQQSWLAEPSSLRGLPLPVVTLEDWSLAPWAQMVAARGKAAMTGLLITDWLTSPVPFSDDDEENGAAPDLTEDQRAKQIVARFRASASPMAYRLACYLAAVELTMSVMRLVQQAMLPRSRQIHLAEVFLGGLLRQPKAKDDDLQRTDEIYYDFHPGVRKILLDLVPKSETKRVMTEVWRLIEQRSPYADDFKVLLSHPGMASEQKIAPGRRAFATISPEAISKVEGGRPKPQIVSEVPPESAESVESAELAKLEKSTVLDELYKRLPDNSLRAVTGVHSNPPEAGRSGRLGIFSLPFPRNKFFIGRDDILKDIHKNFKAGKTVQALSGIGGVGKTQIALEYAYRYQKNYQVVLWGNANWRESLVSDFVAMAGLLNLPDIHVQDQVKTISAVKRWFENNEDWLLILDNADDLIMAREFIPSSETGRILLTTRAQNTKPIAARQVVEKMEPREGALFLLRRLEKIKKDEQLQSAPEELRKQAEALSRLVDGLPLALDQAAAFIEEKPSTLEEYQTLYQSERKGLLNRRGSLAEDHPSVTVTFSLAFKKVADANPAAADLLRVCAFLEADSIPEEIFLGGSTRELGKALSVAAAKPATLVEAIRDAVRFSLLQRTPEARTVSLHRLVQAVIKDDMEKGRQRLWAERAVRAVNKVFPTSEYSNWQACSRLIQHAQSLARSIDEFRFEFPEAARMLNQAGEYLNWRAQYADAEPLFRRALAIREKVFGIEHESVASSLNNLAGLYYNLGKYAEAESIWNRALTITENAFGNEDMRVATMLNNLAELCKKQGRYVQAEPLYHQSLAIYRKTLGDEHPSVAVSFNNLAELYLQQGKYAEAEPLLKRALDIKEKLLGAEHPDAATSLNALAVLYYSRGQYAEAEPLLKRALDIGEKAFGAAHPEVANSLNNLAELYRKQGNYAEAESLDRRALDIREKALSADHPDVATSLNNLALSYSNKRMYAGAESLHRRALDIREKALGSEHPEVANSLENLAGLYFNQGKHAEAEPLLKRALDIREKALGPGHPYTSTSLDNLVELYRAQARYAEAEQLCRRALAVSEKALGAEHPDVAVSLNNLAALYYSQRKYEDAESLYRRALAIRERVFGAEHPDITNSLNNLAALYYNQGKYEEVEPLYQRALAIREKALSAEHPDVANSLNNLAGVYHNQGKYAEAEPLYQRALVIYEKALGAEHPEVATVLRNYSSLLRATNKESEAEKLENRASIIKAGRTRGINSENALAARNKSTLTEGIKEMEYDVAISFAGEQRKEARDIAKGLMDAGVKVFFDEYEDAELWGKNLYEHLSEVYKDRAQYCLILVSAAYAKKVWTSHERRSAQARALQESKEYILPVRIDDTELPGLLPTVSYLDFNRYGAEGICRAFLRKTGRGDSVSEISSELKITTSPLVLIRESDAETYRFIPVVNSKWGSSQIVLTLEPDDSGDRAFLDGLQVRAKMTVAYGNHVAICKVIDITHNKDAGASRWELTLHPESSEFGPTFELGGTATTSKDEYAQKRVRRLLLNEELPGKLDDLNQMMEEIFLRGQGATSQILGSPFPQLYRQYGKEPKTFLEVAWVTGVFFLRTTGTVAEISRFELTLTGQSLTVDFIGRRKKEFSNRPAYEIKVQGTCDLSTL